MIKSFSHAVHSESGAALKHFVKLFLLVACIFVVLSNLSCIEPPSDSGCGDSSVPDMPINTSGSQVVTTKSIQKAPFTPAMSGSTGPFVPRESVLRTMSFPESGAERLTWTPPPGATNFEFIGAPAPEPGGPPFMFFDPPNSITVRYNLPDLPAGTNSMEVAETVQVWALDQGGNYTTMTSKIVRPQLSSASQPAPASQAGVLPAAPPAPAPASAQITTVYQVDQYRSVVSDTLTSAQCQSLYDWFQGDSLFAAIRVPVTVTADSSSLLPVVFGPDVSTRPILQLTIDYQPAPGVADVPLEVRPERFTYLLNNLPAAPGEMWVALGAAAEPKVICPANMNADTWEFYFGLPLDLVGKASSLPTYYCYEGNESPLLNRIAGQVLAGANAASIQAEGITCLGPQDQSLDPEATLHIGNPGVAWNVIPPEQVSFMHYLERTPNAPVNLGITTTLTGSTWSLYLGDDKAPDLAHPITNPWNSPYAFDFFWVVGSVPQGAAPGSYNVTVSAEEAAQPSISTYINDMLWVGEWTPPSGGETTHTVFLPLLLK